MTSLSSTWGGKSTVRNNEIKPAGLANDIHTPISFSISDNLEL
jgi:hypothetical protein